jgi:apolipoprotein N-acyltransferase
VLLIVAAPPWDWNALGLLALVPLLLAIRDRGPWQAAGLAWLTGLVVNLGGTDWLPTLLERFSDISSTTIWLWHVLICAAYALVFALWAGASRWLALRWGVSWLIGAPLVLVLAEALVPMVFPWSLGIAVWKLWPLTQAAELGGPSAVAALLLLINLLLAERWHAMAHGRGIELPVRRGVWVAAAVIALGLLRAGHVAYSSAAAPKLQVAIVQSQVGISSAKQRQQNGQREIDSLREATDTAITQGADLVVWPESSFPYLFDRQMEVEYAPLHPWRLRNQRSARLLVGMLSHEFGGTRLYNSAVLFSANGERAGLADKTRLMPLGEYMPLATRFPDWAKKQSARLANLLQITPGTGPRVLVDGDLRVLPLICYEDLHAAYVATGTRAGDPELLVTLANHAWFDQGSAPAQAMAAASFRSIETRRFLVRSTTTGVSSIHDALGRVRREGPLYRVGPEGPQAPPLVMLDTVARLSVPALGPYAIPVFPWVCALALLLSVLLVKPGHPPPERVKRFSVNRDRQPGPD